MTMFAKEYDFIRYLRMSVRSPFIRNLYSRAIEPIATDELIFIPMIDGLNLTAEQVARYENPNFMIPQWDQITPKIKWAIRRQSVDFFLDDRSHNERNSIQVRVLYGKKLAL
mmetsp:Transcript_31760/g.48726  ORF Transcript_31760/g.48726 Transcript_31760/m.48726 type:complete len:112 (-) Transcript_31760:985-1320(-)